MAGIGMLPYNRTSTETKDRTLEINPPNSYNPIRERGRIGP